MELSDTAAVDLFLQILMSFYNDHGRHDMLWRQPEPDGSLDPYKILVSELMLQQTQVSRVSPKYRAFLERYSSVQLLATAALGDVLQLWSGLGYNRRAKYLWQAARQLTDDYGGVFPASLVELQRLPGVGPNTAGAILAYAFNQPVVYLETNIRTVLIRHFFHDEHGVSDKALRDVLATITTRLQAGSITAAGSMPPRQFYWALMDYGAYLKKTVGNLNSVSKAYRKQTGFEGSRRQLRGRILRMLTEQAYRQAELTLLITDDRLTATINDLLSEGLIVRSQQYLRVP